MKTSQAEQLKEWGDRYAWLELQAEEAWRGLRAGFSATRLQRLNDLRWGENVDDRHVEFEVHVHQIDVTTFRLTVSVQLMREDGREFFGLTGGPEASFGDEIVVG